MQITLQPLLAKDKHNPYLSVYKSEESPNQLEVYFELALLEKVNNGITSYHGKHLLARLYNAKFKRKSLVETFGIPVSTLHRWGDALLTGDETIIHKAFSGQGAEVKITPEIKRYIVSKFNEIYEYEKYKYSYIILSGIKEIFNVQLTSEAIRPIIKNQKEIFNNCLDEPKTIPRTKNNEEKQQKFDFLETNEIEDITISLPENPLLEANTCDSSHSLSSIILNNRNLSLSKHKESEIRIHHLGVVLALYFINNLEFEEKIVYQWLSSILAGAVNIEQTASLDFESLSYLLDQECITSKKHQQTILTKISTEENVNKIFKQNASLLDLKKDSLIYFDPHSISYTGMQDILKGWCGSAGKISKVYYQDFFHDKNGNPIYFKIFDNYFDMRERFRDTLIDDFREIILGDKEAYPTFIIDRGIYGKDKMIAIARKGVGLVTWEKGYLKGTWDSSLDVTTFIIQRPKNNSKDIKTWRVRFIKDETWDKIEGYHRLIVKIKPPQKRDITPSECELSILSNGYISDLEAVNAMLNRWVQENDFKYMIDHFGLNEVTSYKYHNYSDIEYIFNAKGYNEEIQKLLVEKDIYSDEYKQHSKLLTKLNSRVKTLLLKKEKRKENKKQLNPKEDATLKELLITIKIVEVDKKNCSEKISKVASLIKKDFKFLNHDKKNYMDAIKILARNIFYKLIRIFRPIYDNFREDHKLLRELTQASGVIKIKNDVVICIIDTPRNYNKRQQKSIEILLDLLTECLNNSNKKFNYRAVKLQIL